MTRRVFFGSLVMVVFVAAAAWFAGVRQPVASAFAATSNVPEGTTQVWTPEERGSCSMTCGKLIRDECAISCMFAGEVPECFCSNSMGVQKAVCQCKATCAEKNANPDAVCCSYTDVSGDQLSCQASGTACTKTYHGKQVSDDLCYRRD